MYQNHELILWEGNSKLTGKPIVVIATGVGRKSYNRKTGNMVQTYILNRDISPITAVYNGADTSVCGDCKHKPSNLNSCYINLRIPLNVWRAYQRGSYTKFNSRLHLNRFKKKSIRFGAYGDPAAAPIGLWKMLTHVAKNWTGYTHQWKTCTSSFRDIIMASVDTHSEYIQAKSDGWRCFMVVPVESSIMDKSFFGCPASEEMGSLTNCTKCSACNGTKYDKRTSSKDVFIQVHGKTKKRFVPLTIEKIVA